MSFYDRLRVLFDESLTVYDPATAGGSIFTIFALCGIFLLVSKRQQDRRIGQSFIIPSLFLCLFTVNPLIIHFLYKRMGVSGSSMMRLGRLYWVFPFVPVIIYCLTETLSSLSEKWKKLLVSVMLLLLLFWGTDGTILQHYSIADNPYKVPQCTIELTEAIFEETELERPMVVAPFGVMHWFRQYDSRIVVPVSRLSSISLLSPLNEDTLIAEKIAATFAEDPRPDFIVVDGAKTWDGSLENYGFALVGKSFNYELYKRIE